MTADNRTESIPEKDPIVEGSLLWPIFISMVLLLVATGWALYDEGFTRRPYKKYQADWVDVARKAYEKKKEVAEANYLEFIQGEEYQALEANFRAAVEAVGAPYQELQGQLDKEIAPRLAVLGEPVKETRSMASAAIYRIERSREHKDENEERYWRAELAKIEAKTHPLKFPGGEEVVWDYSQMLAEFNRLKALQGRLQGQMARIKTTEAEARNALNDYRDSRFPGARPDAIDKLISGLDEFEVEIKQIHIKLADGELIERCESCHVGIRSPVPLSKDDVAGKSHFVSHPHPELLQIHDVDKMGCTPCHGGNGIATETVTYAHGRNKYWLNPLYEPENTQAGCVECHTQDLYLPGADTFNHGRHLFQWRGCVGCHRHEHFSREEDEFKQLSNRVSVATKDVEATRVALDRYTAITTSDASDEAIAEAFAAIRRAEQNLYLQETRLDELQGEFAGLQSEVKKVGPNLKEISNKLKPGWLQPWLAHPRAFRPSTKMPEFRIDEEQAWDIAAFLWQQAAPVEYSPTSEEGDAERGEWLISVRGCLGCHNVSTSEYGDGIGSQFASSLSRVGEKANYAYLVSWLQNPRLHNPYTVMPSLRLDDQEARDIAAFLVSKVDEEATYPDEADALAVLTDVSRKDRGEKLVKHLGCAGCHEIQGLEREDRIGVELSTHGSKPIERLDFGTQTHVYYKAGKYKHKYFFEDKLRNPAIWDVDKYKPDYWDRLKMPNFWPDTPPAAELKADLAALDPEADDYSERSEALKAQLQVHEDVDGLVTFLLGSRDPHLPQSLSYVPEGLKNDIQEGWWVIQKYNCIGCHQVEPGVQPDLWQLEIYQDGTGFVGVPGANGRPPTLIGQGTRTNPGWLMSFLDNPALTSDPASLHRNGVRQGMAIRMPTFDLSERERTKLVAFFAAMANVKPNYRTPDVEPLSGPTLDAARAAFVAGDCGNCHLLGVEALANVNPETTYAPSFAPVAERINPEWVHRWVTRPQSVIPGTAMPSLLTAETDDEGRLVRWIFAPDKINETARRRLGEEGMQRLADYPGDHADLLRRYFAQWNQSEAEYHEAVRSR